MLGLVGPVLGIATALLSNGDSAEMTFMRKKFAEINQKMDDISEQVKGVEVS